MFDATLNYKLKKRGLLNIESIDYLYTLYLPIIGHNAVYLYVFLMHDINNECDEGKVTDLVKRSDLTLQEFLLAKKSLEGIGLLGTFINTDETAYLFSLNDCETPKNFFTNMILKALFVQTCGEEKEREIFKKYTINEDFSNYTEISAAVKDCFSLDYDSFTDDDGSAKKLVARNKNNIKTNFSDTKLLQYLKRNSQIRIGLLSDDEMETACSIGSIYGLDEKIVSDLMSECFNALNPKGSKLDKEKLKRKARAFVRSRGVSNLKVEEKTHLNSKSDVAESIKYYESISPRDFLKEKQSGVEIVDADKKILEELSLTMNFSNGMINALLDYVLKTTEGDLSRNYILKIAAHLVRKKCINTLDVMNALYGRKDAKINNVNETKAPKVEAEEEKNDDEYANLDDYEDMDVDF